MSKFKTTILVQVDVDGVKKNLPKGSFLHRIEFLDGPPRVEIEWEHDAFLTKYMFPVEFPPENLTSHKLPEGVKMLLPVNGGTTAQEAIASEPVPVDKVTQTNETLNESPGETAAEPGGAAEPEPGKPAKRKRAGNAG